MTRILGPCVEEEEWGKGAGGGKDRGERRAVTRGRGLLGRREAGGAEAWLWRRGASFLTIPPAGLWGARVVPHLGPRGVIGDFPTQKTPEVETVLAVSLPQDH